MADKSQDEKNIPLFLRVHRGDSLTEGELRLLDYHSKLFKVVRVRHGYNQKWSWGAAAKYLYSALIRSLGLEHHEEELLRLAESKPGRKEERELAARILRLRAEGYTVTQMKAKFEREGQHFSKEKIESYLKTRRINKPS